MGSKYLLEKLEETLKTEHGDLQVKICFEFFFYN